MTSQGIDRIYSLDNLRAVLMFLGIVLHSAIPYAQFNPPPQFWPYQDPTRSQIFDLLYFYIHAFRMPLFFVLAGFFARMVFDRHGAAGFLRHRLLRLGIPLAVFLPPLYVYVRQETLRHYPDFTEYHLVTLHLWFIYYLLFYSILAGLLGQATLRWDAPFARFWQGPWRWPVLVAVTAALLFTQYGAGFDPDFELLPKPSIVLCYAFVFSVGWFLYPLRDTLATWHRFAVWQVAGATLLVFAYLPLAAKLYEVFGTLPDRPNQRTPSRPCWPRS